MLRDARVVSLGERGKYNDVKRSESYSRVESRRVLTSQTRTVRTVSSSCAVQTRSSSSSSSPIELETELREEFLLKRPRLPGNCGGHSPLEVEEMGGVEGPWLKVGKYESRRGGKNEFVCGVIGLRARGDEVPLDAPGT